MYCVLQTVSLSTLLFVYCAVFATVNELRMSTYQ